MTKPLQKLIPPRELRKIKTKIKKYVYQTNQMNKEVCGVVVFGSDGYEIRQVKNISESKSVHYRMCPEDLGLKSRDTDLFREVAEKNAIALWHTHPLWDSAPSGVDLENAFRDTNYVIYSIIDDSMTLFQKSSAGIITTKTI